MLLSFPMEHFYLFSRFQYMGLDRFLDETIIAHLSCHLAQSSNLPPIFYLLSTISIGNPCYFFFYIASLCIQLLFVSLTHIAWEFELFFDLEELPRPLEVSWHLFINPFSSSSSSSIGCLGPGILDHILDKWLLVATLRLMVYKCRGLYVWSTRLMVYERHWLYVLDHILDKWFLVATLRLMVYEHRGL